VLCAYIGNVKGDKCWVLGKYYRSVENENGGEVTDGGMSNIYIRQKMLLSKDGSS
jgi:hypothetical protein